MTNRHELSAARKRLTEAADSLAGIQALPRRVGQQVVWSNGVVWTRAGDDRWTPWSASQPADMPELVYSSAHVASGHIVLVGS